MQNALLIVSCTQTADLNVILSPELWAASLTALLLHQFHAGHLTVGFGSKPFALISHAGHLTAHICNCCNMLCTLEVPEVSSSTRAHCS